MVTETSYISLEPSYLPGSRLNGIATAITVVIFVIFIMMICSCNTVEFIQDDNSKGKSMLHGEITILPNELFYLNLIGSELLAVSVDGKTISLYNPKTENTETIYTCNENIGYISNSLANRNWIIWVEQDNIEATDVLNWSITAFDLQQRETYTVDQGQFSERYPVPAFINFAPSSLSISNRNEMVYCKSIISGHNIGSQVIHYDLDSQTRKVLQETDNVIDEWLYDCTINNNIVAWSKFSQLNDDYSFRMSNYKYSDVFLYDISTETIEQLTKEDFYCSPDIFENNLAMVYMPLTRQGQQSSNTEIVLMDLLNKSIETIVDNNSEQYDIPGIGDELLRSIPVINSKYVFWYNTGMRDLFVYDYHEKKMTRVFEADYSNIQNMATITRMFDNSFIIYENCNGKENTLFLEIS